MQRFRVKYQVKASAASIEARAQALAIEQSVEMPLSAIHDARLVETVAGRVELIEVSDAQHFAVTLSLAPETTGFEIGQLLNMLFGNSALHEDLWLEDIELPEAMLARFPGPAWGLAGLRKLLNAPRRPLTCTALKPQGLAPQALAQLAARFAQAGIDLIKDDHGIADQHFAPFAQRVPLIQAAVVQANQRHGTHSLYAPNLSGGPAQLLEQMRIAQDAGIKAVMIAPMISGISVLSTVSAHGFVVLAHPALLGVARIDPALLLGKLFRLAGADAVIYPNHGGRFGFSPARCQRIATFARAPWGPHPAICPVPAGGMHPDRLAEAIAFYGPEVMLLIGGALLDASDLDQAAAEFVRRTAASVPAQTPVPL